MGKLSQKLRYLKHVSISEILNVERRPRGPDYVISAKMTLIHADPSRGLSFSSALGQLHIKCTRIPAPLSLSVTLASAARVLASLE